jgi:hypothetical protein
VFISAGGLLRRTLPAIGVALAGIIAIRFVIFSWLRAHFMTPVTSYFPLSRGFAPTGSTWQLAAGSSAPTASRSASRNRRTGR